jgi:hypothetical protein
MDQNDIIKYFNEYIKNYSPYANNSTFTSLIEYLGNNYLSELYNNIPYNFKQLWEQNKIPNELYDILLQNIGVPKKILNELSQIDKISFFNNFNNFNQYRGNLDFFDKMSKLNLFNTFNVYELYIDYYIDDWIFKPKKVINNIDFTDNVFLEYNSIYNNVPNFLINKSQLDYYKNNNEIVLPFKSNLLLLKYLFLYKETEISNLIFSTFLKEYNINTFILYFKDEQFNVSLKMFTTIWFYLFLKLYDTTSFVEISNIFKCLLYLNSNNPYNINDLENIINEYNLISNTEELYLFYKQYLIDYFLQSTTFNEFNKDNLLNYIDTNITEYLDTRISISDNINTYNIIFNELLNSFEIYLNSSIDENFITYSEYFLNSLTRLIIDPKKTGSFKLLNHYKPFHVDLITDHNTYIKFDSKFNINIPSVKYDFKYKYNSIENFNILEYNKNIITLLNINNILNINEEKSFKYTNILNENVSIDDTNINFELNQTLNDNNNLTEYDLTHFTLYNQKSLFSLNDIHSVQSKKILNEDVLIDDTNINFELNQTLNDDNNLTEYDINHLTLYNQKSLFSLNDIHSVQSKKILNEDVLIDDTNIKKILNKKETEYKLLSEHNIKKIYILNNNCINLLNLTDYVNIIHLLPDIQYIEHALDQLELYCNYSNYEIYYTIDGSDPTIDSILYTGYININGNQIKAIAYNELDNSFSNIFKY